MLTTASNSTANTAIRYLKSNASDASSSVAKLSSGSRIVKASDDAASLAVGTKLKADITALKQAQTNTSNAQSLLQVADGGMARISDMLQRMKALATQASSGSVSNAERSFINQEYSQLRTQIGDVASQTKFSGQQLLNGSAAKSVTNANAALATRGVSLSISGNATTSANWALSYANATGTFTLTDGTRTHTSQISTAGIVAEGSVEFAAAGITVNLSNFDDSTDLLAAAGDFDVVGGNTLDFQVGAASTEVISVNINDVSVTATGLGTMATAVDTSANAATAGNEVDTAITRLNAARAGLGATMSRFEFAGANLATQVENLDAARSTLMDVDVAVEMSKFSSANVLQQAATAMLAQANQMPQGLLRLLQ
jgi:flagellin